MTLVDFFPAACHAYVLDHHTSRSSTAAAVRRSPDDPSYRADFAKALRAQGAFDDARAEYAKAAELGARRSELDQALSYYLVDRPSKEEEERISK